MCIYPNLTVCIYIYTPQQYPYTTISNVFFQKHKYCLISYSQQ